MAKNQCCVVGCGNKYSQKTGKDCRLFTPPLNNKKLLARWHENIHRDKFKLTNNTKVCQKHFLEECFIKGVYGPGPEGKQVLMSEFKKWNLTNDAIPTLKMGIHKHISLVSIMNIDLLFL